MHVRTLRRLILLSLLAICFCPHLLYASDLLRLRKQDVPLQAKHVQTPALPAIHQFVGAQILDDLAYLSSEPDFLGVVGGLAIAPKLFESSFLKESPSITEMWGTSSTADLFFESGELLGDAIVPISAAFLSMGMGEIADDNSLGRFGYDLMRTQAANGILTIGLKRGIDRKRPNGGAHSYPSGHTSSAFALAGTVYRHYGEGWGTAAFALAGYIGLSRLQENMHYLSDVVAGAVLGSYVSLKITGKRTGRKSMLVSPIVSPGSYGVSMHLTL